MYVCCRYYITWTFTWTYIFKLSFVYWLVFCFNYICIFFIITDTIKIHVIMGYEFHHQSYGSSCWLDPGSGLRQWSERTLSSKKTWSLFGCLESVQFIIAPAYQMTPALLRICTVRNWTQGRRISGQYWTIARPRCSYTATLDLTRHNRRSRSYKRIG